MNRPQHYTGCQRPYEDGYQFPFGGNVMFVLHQQQYTNRHQQQSYHSGIAHHTEHSRIAHPAKHSRIAHPAVHSRIAHPAEHSRIAHPAVHSRIAHPAEHSRIAHVVDHNRMAHQADVSRQLQNGFRMMNNEIPNVRLSTSHSTNDANQQPQLPAFSWIKQEKHDHMTPESDNNFCTCFERDNEDVNSQKSKETGPEDPVGKEINQKIAKFIEYRMTNKQSADRFRSMYDATHHPTNVASLEGVQLNSGGKTDGSEPFDRMQYAQNCMLKGVTKTAYVMDTLFKHVEKLPKELQPKQLMSDLDSAMRFFGAANLEFMQMRNSWLQQNLNASGSNHAAVAEYDSMLMRQKIRTGVRTKGHRHGTSRFHPYN